MWDVYDRRQISSQYASHLEISDEVMRAALRNIFNACFMADNLSKNLYLLSIFC